ncbi:MAG: hypothetical protein ABJP70_09200 [Erythrobacter sp.]
MRISKSVWGALAAFALVAAPAQAQNQPQVVTQFNDSTISRLLLDVQANFNIETGPNGEKIFRASAGQNTNFTVSPRSCNANAGCVGLLLIATFTRSDSRSLAELDALLNRHNDLNSNAKIYRTPDGTVVLQSYINAVQGISYANAQAQILVFGGEIGKARQALSEFSEGG